MKITFLIGNGLDINMGMKTKYADFYEHLKSKVEGNSGNKIIDDLVNEYFDDKYFDNNKSSMDINREKIDWSDFEIAIGQYTKIIGSEKGLENFINSYEEFIELFTDYLEKNTKSEAVNLLIEENLKQFDYSIKNPISTTEKDQLTLNSKYSVYKNERKYLNYVVFNYTEIFDEMHKKWKTHYSQSGIVSNDPIHIHGYCQEEILLGVNDELQIRSEFSSNENLQLMMVKTISNQNTLTLRFNKTLNLIKESNLIIIYGMSLGDSDKYWWETIVESLKEDVNRCVLIYAYEANLQRLVKHPLRMNNKKQEWRNKLLRNANSEDIQNLNNQIFVEFETKRIFNFKSINM